MCVLLPSFKADMRNAEKILITKRLQYTKFILQQSIVVGTYLIIYYAFVMMTLKVEKEVKFANRQLHLHSRYDKTCR